jgi:peptide/nickel transport system substrate-binding protein
MMAPLGARLRLRRMAAGTALAVACGTSAAALGSCGGDEAEQGGTVKVAMSAFPDFMDPQLSYTVEGWESLWLVYTPLLTYRHEAGEAGTDVIPGLAEDLPEVSEDGKTYTLELRDGIEYSDGTPIRASDFEYGVERMFDLNSPGSPFYTDIVGARDYQAGKADEISGIDTDDESGEITIELAEPRGTFPNELALMFVAPISQDTPKDQQQTKDPPPATGPYLISEVDSRRGFVLERNPQFDTIVDAGADIPEGNVDRIDVEVVKNQSSQVNEVERNEVDFMVDPPPADRLPEVRSRYADRFREEVPISTYFFWMNTRQPPFDDVRVRRAVNYAIDPAAIQRLYGGLLESTQQILPPGMPGYEHFELYPGPDLDRARELIADADPEDTEVTVWTDDEQPSDKVGAYYQDVLEQIGFDTTLKVIDANIYFQQIGNLDTPDLDTGWANWFQDYPHPNDFFEPLLDGDSIAPTNNTNNAQADFPQLDKQIDELGHEPLGEAEDGYAALDRAFMKQAVWAPYGTRKLTTFVSDRLDFDELYFHLLFQHDWTSFAFND